ncbi:TPA: hypothetical protein ACVO35_004175 [Vibrio alginolyticus]|uniref:hypothetical protein n=1 Tax=Vibrio alginolyticus TaxID=663 RepID=UPI0007A9B723|nr:hypothetical protein [Vibrio alginolyticus]KZC46051.1 hypothetical protein XM68_c12651 [Vibrio alginolyticus]
MESLIIAVVTGVVSSVATIAAIKVDIGWIKQVQSELKATVKSIEVRVTDLEKSLD